MVSSSCKLLNLFPEIDGKMKLEHPELRGDDGLPSWPRMILVFAPMGPIRQEGCCDLGWFDRILKAGFAIPPQIQREKHVRAYQRLHITNSRMLGADGWANWVAGRIHATEKP